MVRVTNPPSFTKAKEGLASLVSILLFDLIVHL